MSRDNQTPEEQCANPFNVPYGYCRCSCGEKTPVYRRNYYDRGLRKGEHAPFVRFHRSRLNFTVKENGCWEWNGRPDSDGYASTHWDNVSVKVYRAMYELRVGPIPAGMMPDHLCRNRICVNPSHIEPVTPAQNVQRGNSAKLAPSDVLDIRTSTETLAALSRKYKVDPRTIAKIRKGLRWQTI